MVKQRGYSGLDIDGEVAGDGSGYSISMNAIGDRVAIGAPRNDGNGSSAGHVRFMNGLVPLGCN